MTGLQKALMGICLLGLMLVNLRADYAAHLLFNLGSIISLLLSFLIAYDVHVPKTQRQSPREQEARPSAGWSDIDIGAIVQHGIDARGTGVTVLVALRDTVNLLRKWAGMLDPVLCVLLGLIGTINGEGWTLLLGAAPAIGEFSTAIGSSSDLMETIVVCLVVIVARRELKPLDVTGLEHLRYDYKGA